MNINPDFLKAFFSATLWLSVLLSYILFRRREASGAKYLSLLMLSVANWTGGILLSLVSSSIQMKDFGMAIIFCGTIFVPSFLLAFVLDFTGLRKYLSWKVFLPLNIFPLLILLICLIPSTQHLLWKIESVNPINNVTLHSNGPLYIPWVSYVYTLYAVSVLLLFRGLKIFSSYYKRQILIFIFAAIPPIIFHLVFFLEPTPSNLVNPTPLGFAIAVTIIFFGIYNFQVFNLIPVARQKVIETINDAVLVTDTYSRIVMHNDAFKTLFSLTNENLIGTHLENILPQFEKTVFPSNYKTVDFIKEYSYNGKTFDLSVKPLKKNDTKIVGKLIVLHDISHQKKIVEQLHLANIQLQNQLTFNESLIEDLSAFSHTVAHNLKEPLNNIVGYSELILTNKLDQLTKDDFITQINSTGLKMTEIIEELILLSGISIKEIITQPVDIEPTINDALIRNENEIKNKKATLIFPPKWPEVKGYAPWIEEVWSNLISNALKYGGEIPELTFGFEKKGASEIAFYLQDNGKGLSAAQIDKLFIPFSLLENSEEGSHGLGLSIVKRIIAKLNGTVWAESDNVPGKGSKFYFTLPLR
jgi:PAS domain S-box-containing protein